MAGATIRMKRLEDYAYLLHSDPVRIVVYLDVMGKGVYCNLLDSFYFA